jgi:hypothetical protein
MSFPAHILHDYAVRRRLARILILMIARALAPPPPPPVIEVDIVHEPIVEIVVAIADHWPVHHHGRRRRIRPSNPMIVCVPVHGHHGASHRRRSTPTTTIHHWRISPLSGNYMSSANMASNKLVTSPGSLDHLNRLAISKAAITCWTVVWWCDQSLVGLAIGAIEEVGEEATRLAHGDPGMAAGRRIVQCAAAHPDKLRSEVRRRPTRYGIGQ